MITRTILPSAIRRIAPGLVLGTMFLAMNAAAASVDIPVSADVFIRSLSPNTTHDADLISIRNLAGEQRYGIIQFDLSTLVGQAVTSVELILDEIGSTPAGSDANYPLVSAAYIIGSGSDVPDVSSMTWNSYQATYEGQEGGVFATLGAYNLPANGTSRASQSTFGNAADRALIQSCLLYTSRCV